MKDQTIKLPWSSEYLIKKKWKMGRFKIGFSWRTRGSCMGRFGGGWNWKIGVQWSDSKILISLLVAELILGLEKRTEDKK